jgi:hypothetical protein
MSQDGRTAPDGLIAANTVRAEQHDTPTNGGVTGPRIDPC